MLVDSSNWCRASRETKETICWVGGVWIETEGRKQDLVVFLLSDGKATEWASLSEGCSTLLRMQLVQQGCRFGHAECGYRWDSMG